jgi:hypothetical protein
MIRKCLLSKTIKTRLVVVQQSRGNKRRRFILRSKTIAIIQKIKEPKVKNKKGEKDGIQIKKTIFQKKPTNPRNMIIIKINWKFKRI